IDLQRADFKRLGVLGDWDRPYLTMSPGYEAQQLRAFGRIIRNGHLYKGVKPVHWCLDCRSALAEAEVEYEEKVSPAIDVAFRVADRDDLAARADRGGRAPGTLAQALRPGRRCRAGAIRGPRPGGTEAAAPLAGPAGAGRARGARDARCRHRRGAHRPGARDRGFRRRAALRPAGDQPGG